MLLFRSLGLGGLLCAIKWIGFFLRKCLSVFVIRLFLPLFLCLFCARGVVASPGDPWTFNFYFENDLFSDTDEQYTNGIKLSLVSPDLTSFIQSKFPLVPQFFDKHVPYLNNPDVQKNVAISLGQNTYTPGDFTQTSVIPDDRPYGGWLYMGLGFHAKTRTVQNTVEIQMGVVGANSYAREAQDFVHNLRGFNKAMGWDNQLSNEFGMNIAVERRWRFESSTSDLGWGYDGVAHAIGVLGNVDTHAGVGFEGRFGYNLPRDFGTSPIRPGGETSVSVEHLPTQYHEHDYGILLFASVEGRAIARDIFLDGNTFTNSHSVEKESFVGDFSVGVKVKCKRFKISYAQIHRSRQFKTQKQGHSFGSILVSYRFF